MEPELYEKEHIRAIRKTLGECMVLLKSDGSFPLDKPCRIAAYGNGVRHTVKGGTGSGEVNSRFFMTVEKGLQKAGFEITTQTWLSAFDIELKYAHEEFMERLRAEAKEAHALLPVYAMGRPEPAPEYTLPLEGEGDTAIYVVSRISGEGNDREEVRGDILLTDSEVRDILAANEKYEKFMLVLNTGGVVDLTPVTQVKNILILSQLGVSTGSALADVLLGKTYPSGKLSSTWAGVDEYYPMDDFDDRDETRYTEGIYVGYRYFDTFGKKALFPFGYGLSYTEWRYGVPVTDCEGDRITVSLDIKNIGDHAGRETVQAYLSSPAGKLSKPYQELCGFAKTGELMPGEKEKISISFNLSDYASYDTDTASYILEQGDYILRVGRNSADTSAAAVITISTDVTVLKARNVLGENGFKELDGPAKDEQTKDNGRAVRITLSAADIAGAEVCYEKEYDILPEVQEMPIEEAALLLIGDFSNRHGIAGIIGESSKSVCGAAGETCSLDGRVPAAVMSDGPAGLRLSRKFYEDKKGKHAYGQSTLPESMAETMPKGIMKVTKVIDAVSRPGRDTVLQYQYCTAIPIGTAIAQSFNPELARLYGDIVGDEMERFGITLWLAPALNIHRSIRCGRNFEYYSEDPLVSGIMAAGITGGVQNHSGCYTTIKHYAANNKEANRYCNNSRVSERAMREIYLRGFGICVKLSQPGAVMTSYNLLNGVHTAEHRGLIEDILRAEYGFEGMVMTDWVVPLAEDRDSIYRNSKASMTAAAGGDLFMPGSAGDYRDLMRGYKKGIVSEKQIRINASRVLKLARMTNKVRGM